jgi:hypothetical protein
MNTVQNVKHQLLRGFDWFSGKWPALAMCMSDRVVLVTR